LNGSGADSFTINGLLTVPAGKTQGTYVGSYDVTVSY
jgi:hypothetical protein